MTLLEIMAPLGTLLLDVLLQRNYVDKSKGEPLLCEEALVHAKSEYGNYHYPTHIIHFYIAARDTVVNCSVPEEIFLRLEKGQRGKLCHQGGAFYSFECNGVLIGQERSTRKIPF